MSATKQPLAPVAEVVGLSAIGCSAGWEVSVDEASSRRGRKWFLQVEGPSVFVCVAIQSPAVVPSLLAYLQEPAHLRRSPTPPAAAFPLGEGKDHAVSVCRDDEFSDRCFLILETKSKTVIRVTIGGEDWHNFVHALANLHRDIESNVSDDHN